MGSVEAPANPPCDAALMQELVGNLAQYLEHFAYFGTFFLLFLCGIALPMPEEPILIAAGYVAWKSIAVAGSHPVNVWVLMACALCGVMLGDLTIYSVGKRHGDWIFRFWILRRVFPERRLERARRLFAGHGAKVVFLGRFMAGVRLVVFFTAGMLGVRIGTFFLFDVLAALLTVPISIYAGYHFGSDIDDALAFAGRSHRIVIAIALTLVAAAVLAKYLIGRRHALREVAAAGPPSGVSLSRPPETAPSGSSPRGGPGPSCRRMR